MVTLSGTTFATTTTNSTGEYELKGEPNGSYTITPSKPGYKFNSTQISPLDKHYDNVDFIGKCGKITSVSPTSGTVGTFIVISGEGFDGGERIRISFGEIITVTMLTSHFSGSFSTTFTAGILPAGTHTISAYGFNSTVLGVSYFFLMPGTLSYIVVSPALATLTVAGTRTFTATGYDGYGNEIGGLVWGWQSAIGSVNPTSGTSTLFTGTTTTLTGTLTANYGSITGYATIILQAGTLSYIVVSPALATLIVAGTRTFTATGYDVYGNKIGALGWSWQSAVGSVNPTVGTLTLFTGTTTPLTGTLTATYGSITGYATITLQAGTLSYIVVSPAMATLTVGGTRTFTVTGYDGYGNEVGALAWSWQSAVGSVNPTAGTLTLFTGTTTTLTGTLTANYGSITGYTTITLQAGTLSYIVISPATATLTVGGTRTFTAISYDGYGNEIGALGWSWQSAIGSVNPTVGTLTLFTGTTTPLTDTLTATYGSITGYAVITLQAGTLSYIVVSPATVTLTAAGTKVFTATGYDGYGNEIGALGWGWQSAIGSVNPTAGTSTLFTGMTTPLTGTLTATYGSITGYATITLQVGTLSYIVVSPALAALTIGGTRTFTATGYDGYGNKIGELGWCWQSAVGSVNPTFGTLTLFTGTTTPLTGTLTATYGSITGYATITLYASTLSYIVVSPAIATLIVGGTRTFTAIGYDGYGNEIGELGWSWQSAIGNVTPTFGTLTLFTGTTTTLTGTLTATYGSITGYAVIALYASTLSYIVVSPAIATLTVGGTRTFTAIGYDGYGNEIGELGWGWQSAIGNVTPTFGTLTLFTGTTTTLTGTLTATYGSITGYAVITLKSDNVLHHFNISEPAATYLINSEIPLIITAEDTYGNILTDYNGTFSLTEETQTIYPHAGYFTSGRFSGTVSISRTKPHIRITVTAGDKMETSNPFTTLIDSELGGKVTENTGASIEIETLPADFYITIDSEPEQQRLEINLANDALSHDPTSRGIDGSLHLFQSYDKDDKPIQPGTNSFILISLPFPDENQDEFVDYPEVRMREQTLKIYELKNSRWQEVKNSRLYPYENIVSAQVSRFGVYMLIGQIIPTNLDILVVYPNPFKPVRGDMEIIFDGLPTNTSLRIYDISGNLIKHIENITDGTYAWDVKDSYGKDVASGIYIYIVTSDEEMKKVGKIAVVR